MRRKILPIILIGFILAATVAVFFSGNSSKGDSTKEDPSQTIIENQPDQNNLDESLDGAQAGETDRPLAYDELDCSDIRDSLEVRAACFAEAYGKLLPEDTEKTRRNRIEDYVTPEFWDNNSVTIGSSMADQNRIDSKISIYFMVKQSTVYIGSVELNGGEPGSNLEEVTMWGATIIVDQSGQEIDRNEKQTISTWTLRNGIWQVLRYR